MKIYKVLAVTILVILSACSTTPVQMSYSPSAGKIASVGTPVVTIASVTDDRKNGPNWLGAIRGGFGNPLKTLETEKPVSEVVKSTVMDGLAAHGLLAHNTARYTLNIDMMRFDCNQYARREAHILLNISLIDTATNQTIYIKTLKADKVTGSIITFDAGLFASVDDLRQVANDVLQDAIDQLLSDPEFLQKLRS